MAENPIFARTAVPLFDKILPEHFEPAADQAIAAAQKTLALIKGDPAKATFENTVAPLESLFFDIEQVENLLECFYLSKLDDGISAVNKVVSQKISAFRNCVFQDRILASRFQAVSFPGEERAQIVFNDLSDAFEKSGAFLSEVDQEKIRDIDARLVALSDRFNVNCRESAKQEAVLFMDPADMDGIPESIVANYKENAIRAGHQDGWLAIPERLQIDTLLEIAKSPKFREKMAIAIDNVGTREPYDNHPVIREMGQLRHERVQLIDAGRGKFLNYAAYAISKTMAYDVPRVQALLQSVLDYILPEFEKAVEAITGFARENGGPELMKPSDLPYWANQYRQATTAFDSVQASQYLELENTVRGYFG